MGMTFPSTLRLYIGGKLLFPGGVDLRNVARKSALWIFTAGLESFPALFLSFSADCE